ncbi:unnamed protein product [Gadus morhua 'NCC']
MVKRPLGLTQSLHQSINQRSERTSSSRTAATAFAGNRDVRTPDGGKTSFRVAAINHTLARAPETIANQDAAFGVWVDSVRVLSTDGALQPGAIPGIRRHSGALERGRETLSLVLRLRLSVVGPSVAASVWFLCGIEAEVVVCGDGGR